MSLNLFTKILKIATIPRLKIKTKRRDGMIRKRKYEISIFFVI